MEVWKTVPGTDGYLQISNEGRAKSLLRGEGYILKACLDKKGYLRLRMTIKRKRYSFKIHRLVAEAFLENPNNLPQVNHKDGDKTNNRVENLEWVTNQQNVIHYFSGEKCSVNEVAYIPKRMTVNGRKIYTNRNGNTLWSNPQARKAVVAYKDGEEKHFDSVSDAERYFNSRHITAVLKGKRQHVKGWTFSYKEGGDAYVNPSAR